MFSFDLSVSYRYSIIVSTAKIEYTVHSPIGLLGWNLLKDYFKQLYSGDPGEKNKKSRHHWRSTIIFINKADSKVSLKVRVMQCYDKIRSCVWFSISTDVTKNYDYPFQSIKLTNQSTNIEYYRLIDNTVDDRFRSIRYTLVLRRVLLKEKLCVYWEQTRLKKLSSYESYNF